MINIHYELISKNYKIKLLLWRFEIERAKIQRYKEKGNRDSYNFISIHFIYVLKKIMKVGKFIHFTQSLIFHILVSTARLQFAIIK